MRLDLRAIVVVVALAAAGVAAWRWLAPGDEAQIRGALDRMAASMRAETGEGELARLARLQALRDELSPDLTVDAGEPFARLAGREEAVATAGRFVASVRDLEIRFVDVSVSVAPGAETATVSLTAEARFTDRSGPGFDARELEMVFGRRDGRWLLESVALVRVLQPVGRGPARRAAPGPDVQVT
ncbi:MAG: hypothetical protein AB7H88_19720 [Vicinamibacterales bacterium]